MMTSAARVHVGPRNLMYSSRKHPVLPYERGRRASCRNDGEKYCDDDGDNEAGPAQQTAGSLCPSISIGTAAPED
eukprot:6198927-Pleurochrysis_carterae.AAC.3